MCKVGSGFGASFGLGIAAAGALWSYFKPSEKLIEYFWISSMEKLADNVNITTSMLGSRPTVCDVYNTTLVHSTIFADSAVRVVREQCNMYFCPILVNQVLNRIKFFPAMDNERRIMVEQTINCLNMLVYKCNDSLKLFKDTKIFIELWRLHVDATCPNFQ
jgi:hypothetical protein